MVTPAAISSRSTICSRVITPPSSVSDPSAVTFLFTDIEGSTRLWEQEPERMLPSVAQHDAVSKAIVERHRGTIVKMRGDGIHAAFENALDALRATIEIQRMLQAPREAAALELRLRCGLHAGIDERRDGDFYGRAVNRAARIANAAHGGQILLSKAVADHVDSTLPEDVALRDLGMVRLRDLAEPEHIFQVYHPQLRADFPPLRALEATPNNLAQQLNSFIGRERELAEVKGMLESNRLVTLLGMGGIGKSRLSIQLAADVLDDFPDGVWFIELAALTDSSAVPQAVASVLGVKEEAGKPVIDALTKYVRDLQILIVLDNCEQVVHGCADVAKRLLQAGAQVKVLASSRDYLRIAGETAYQVPTLSVPKNQISLEALVGHEAVRLFIDRAAASMRGFGLTEQNAAAIADICYCLDGIPLAIELAAARVRSLSVQNIAARLNDRFRLLVTADQTVLPRQRTLRALIDWSYDLLSDQERTLFERLSVFAGGWTLEAAEAVCADDKVTAREIVDLIGQLVEKSLVIAEVNAERYQMLDTVRHYAQEKLTRGVNQQALNRLHLEYFLEFAEAERAHYGGPGQEASLERVDRERANLLSAHRWIDGARDAAELGLRLISALKGYWINRGLLGLGHQLISEALQRSDATRKDHARCRALFDAGQLCCFMGRYADAKSYLEPSLAIARELGDKMRVASVLQPLGMAAVGLGDLRNARIYLEEAVALARELSKQRELAAALMALAQLHRLQGELDMAEPLYAEALMLARSSRDQETTAIGLLNLSMVSIASERVTRANDMLIEALVIAKNIGSRLVGQSALEVSAASCVSSEAWKEAALLFGAAEAHAKAAGMQRDAVDEAFLSPLMIRTKNELGPSQFDTLRRDGEHLSYEDALNVAATWLERASLASST